MAIYHQHLKVLSRLKGRNTINAIAYRRAIKLVDPITGEVYDYSHKKNVIHSEIILPKNAPLWLEDIAKLGQDNPTRAAQLLANSIELREKRKDSQLLRETEISLPLELSKEQNLALCRDFISFFTDYGMVAEFSIHWDKGNPHAHILLSMRELTEQGWGNKVRHWNDKALGEKARAIWAEKENYHLALAGFETKVSHLSNRELGIDQEPTIHEGNRFNLANQQAKIRNKEVRLRNLQKLGDNPEIILDKLSVQRATFNLEDIAKILGTQLEAVNQEDFPPQPPKPGSSRIKTRVVDFLGSVAPQWFPLEQTTSYTNLQAHLTDASLPNIEILPDASPHQVMAQVLAEMYAFCKTA